MKRQDGEEYTTVEQNFGVKTVGEATASSNLPHELFKKIQMKSILSNHSRCLSYGRSSKLILDYAIHLLLTHTKSTFWLSLRSRSY